MYLIILLIEIAILSFIFFKIKKGKFIYHEPILIFILGSSFIYILIPLIMFFFDWSWHNKIYSEDSYIKASVFSFFIIITTVALYQILNSLFFKKNTNNKKFKLRALNKLSFIAIIIFLLIVFIDNLYLVKYISSFNYEYYLRNRIILRKGMGGIILLSYMSTLLLPILYTHIFIKGISKNKIAFLVLILISLFFLYSYIMMGNRLTAFMILMMILFSYLYLNNRKIIILSYFKLLVILSLIFIFFSALGYQRKLGISLTDVNIQSFFMVLSNEIEHAIVINFGNFEHLVWLIENKSKWSILYGKTFLAGFLNIIPRSIWSEKWLGGGPNLINIIYPGSYNLNGSNITSFTTGLIVESYMNFKYLSLVIIPMGMALLLISLKKMLYAIRGQGMMFILYLFLLFNINFILMFGEFLGTYTTVLILIIPILFINIITKNK